MAIGARGSSDTTASTASAEAHNAFAVVVPRWVDTVNADNKAGKAANAIVVVDDDPIAEEGFDFSADDEAEAEDAPAGARCGAPRRQRRKQRAPTG